MKIQGIGVAHAKIILIGEHAVVYGHPGIALPFTPLKVKVVVTQSEEDFIESKYYHGPLISIPESLNFILILIDDLKSTLKVGPIHLTIENYIPESAGLGSSAAISNAIVKAVYDFMETELPSALLFEKTQIAEKVMHGSPSGIDALVTVSEEAYYFIKGKEPTIIPIQLPGYLVVADSWVQGKTKAAVKIIASLYLKNMAQADLESLGIMGVLAKEAIEKKEIDDVARLMNQAHYHLQTLQVSDPIVDKMVSLSLQAGALGAKLTGGGLGGCILALCETKDIAEKVIKSLTPIAKDHIWMMPLL
jgi:mevalonate kinase